jgi:hypothetical protein
MRIPRRYRFALMAYPPAYRASRGSELAATLADGDDERGHPSMREAGALAGRGLAMRLGAAGSGESLLVIAAALVLATLLSGFTWAERVFLYRGEAAAYGTDTPGLWWTIALGVSAWLVLAAGPMRAVDDPRRRRIAVLLTFPLFVLIWTSPGRLVVHGAVDLQSLVEYLRVLPSYALGRGAIELTAAALATWASLRALRRLDEPGRRYVMAAALAFLAGAAVVQAAVRPDLPAEYAQSAFADLGTAAFLAALAMLVALAALVRLRFAAHAPAASG